MVLLDGRGAEEDEEEQAQEEEEAQELEESEEREQEEEEEPGPATEEEERPPPPSPEPTSPEPVATAMHYVEEHAAQPEEEAAAATGAPALAALTWSEVSSPQVKRPNTALARGAPDLLAANARLAERPQTARIPQRARMAGTSLARPMPIAHGAPSAVPVAPEASGAPLPRYMQTTRASGSRHASTAADSSWLCDMFGLPVPSPRPRAVAAPHRPGNYRRAWRFVEASPRDHPPAMQPAVLRVADGNGPVGRRGAGDASSRREWLLQQPMPRRRVIVNQYGGAVSASLAYAAPHNPANWLPPISSF